MEKTNRVISSTIRSTSCSHGWLKQVNQFFFGAVTVLLFVLLMLVVLNEAITNNKRQEPCEEDDCEKCYINGCSVICTNTGLQINVEDPIIDAIKEADASCQGLTISLNNPQFYDSTLPMHWMSRLALNVNSLSIIGGNLRHINTNAFMSYTFRNLQTLTLESVTIEIFHQDALIGLSSLLELNIRSCSLYDISENALRPVDETLRTLQIKESDRWDPRNITGSLYLVNLTVVDLTFNNFNSILNKQTFQGLAACRLLYLSSSGITAIGEGAFDYLDSINRINLNDNLLTTLPERIFDRIIALSINYDLRIDLHDNPWHCDCQLESIRQMYIHNYLMVDPVCTTPDIYNNRPFSDIETFCDYDTSTVPANMEETLDANKIENSYINTLCDGSFIKNITVHCEKPKEENWSGIEYIFKNIVASHENETEADESLLSAREAFSMTVISLFRQLKDSQFEMIWFHSTCPSEIYCVTSVSHNVRVFDEQNATFFYCLVDKSAKTIRAENCFKYFLSTLQTNTVSRRYIVGIIYGVILLASTLVSASVVFYAVRKNPMLLKGSKRVLLVKHRVADAIVLPPKFRERSNFVRSESPKSVWSNKSGTPSYISALQPTEDQLAMWRLNHLFDPQLTSISCSEKMSLSMLDSKENMENGEKGGVNVLNINGHYI